jgi:hypothetical protein
MLSRIRLTGEEADPTNDTIPLMNTQDPGYAFARIGNTLEGIASRKRTVFLAVIVTVQFCLIMNSSWKATPDSALYLALGESLARGEGYVFNGEPHTFVPPGLPLMLGAVARVFSPDFAYYRILMAIFGLLAAALGYLFVARSCGRDTALVVGGLVAVNHALVENSTLILADVPFAFFTFAALNSALAAVRSPNRALWLVLSGLLMGILPVIRINGAATPIATAIFLLYSWNDVALPRRIRFVVVFLCLAFLPALAWQYWTASLPVSVSEGTYLHAVAGRTWGDQLHVIVNAFLGYFPELTSALTGISFKVVLLELPIPILIAVGLYQALVKGERLLTTLTIIHFCGLLLSTAGTRYVIFLLPGLYLFFALGLLSFTDALGRRTQRSLNARKILIGVFALFALLNAGHNVITIVHARTALEKNGPEDDRTLPFFIASRWLKANAPEATVLTSRSRIIHYLSGCRTISLVRSGVPEHQIWLNTQEEVQSLVKQTKPQFLYADTKDSRYYSHVIESIKAMGVRLEEIPEASSKRYRLFRMLDLSAGWMGISPLVFCSMENSCKDLRKTP